MHICLAAALRADDACDPLNPALLSLSSKKALPCRDGMCDGNLSFRQVLRESELVGLDLDFLSAGRVLFTSRLNFPPVGLGETYTARLARYGGGKTGVEVTHASLRTIVCRFALYAWVDNIQSVQLDEQSAERRLVDFPTGLAEARRQVRAVAAAASRPQPSREQPPQRSATPAGGMARGTFSLENASVESAVNSLLASVRTGGGSVTVQGVRDTSDGAAADLVFRNFPYQINGHPYPAFSGTGVAAIVRYNDGIFVTKVYFDFSITVSGKVRVQ